MAPCFERCYSVHQYHLSIKTQKKYTVDFLTKKQKVNEGEVSQYYVENSHPAIISSDVFDMVQQEMKRRKTMKNRYSGSGMFSSKIDLR